MANARIVNTPTQAIPQNSAAHTQRTISNSAVAVINHTLNTQSSHVLVQFNGADARVTFDGTNPTTTLGFLFVNGSTAYWTPTMASAAKGIRAGATDVVVEIQELNYL
jgi:hypothetical protein